MVSLCCCFDTEPGEAHLSNREVASLNEFRTFFGLEPHVTFKDVNADPEIQNALQNLYDSPDMIEMYPGIFIEGIVKEEGKKSKGVGFPGTAGRGVLSDAVTLVRSDRFYTTDYTTATLTNWGLCEAQSDYKTLVSTFLISGLRSEHNSAGKTPDFESANCNAVIAPELLCTIGSAALTPLLSQGGSMFHKLLHRGLPGLFDFNSVYAMQPMYTSASNKEIFQRLNVSDQYSMNPPKAPTIKVSVESHAAVCDALLHGDYFESTWSASVGTLVSQKASNGFDILAQAEQTAGSKQIFLEYLLGKADSTVRRSSFRLRKSQYQIDIVRE